MKRISYLLVIAALAAGFWFYQSKLHTVDKPIAREVAPQRWMVNENASTGSSAVPGGTAAVTTPAANATIPVYDNATTISAGEEQLNATTDGNATGNATAAGPEDAILQHGFLADTSAYLVSRYFPGNSVRNPAAQGRLDLNVKSVNIRYGVDFPGMAVDPADTLGSRKIVFAHLLNQQVLDFLYENYLPIFLERMDQALAAATYESPSGATQQLSPAQRSEMLTLLGARLKNVGRTVGILVRTSTIMPLVQTYVDDMEKVNIAHQEFWQLQADNAALSATNAASSKIKTSIQNREMSRNHLLRSIVKTGGPQGMDASELVFLAQWVYRRGQADPASLPLVAKAADLIATTGQALQKHAQEQVSAGN